MAFSNRERYVSWILIGASTLFALDQVALEPYLSRRKELVAQRAAKDDELEKANRLLDREKADRLSLARIQATIKSEPSDAQTQLLHLLSEWEQQAGVTNASFQRTQLGVEHGYTHISFHVSANGTMAAIAMLLYRVENASIPMRVDDVQVSPRRDTGDDLQLQLTVSTISGVTDSATPAQPQTQPAESVEVAGDPR